MDKEECGSLWVLQLIHHLIPVPCPPGFSSSRPRSTRKYLEVYRCKYRCVLITGARSELRESLYCTHIKVTLMLF
jgi:hypothetical protein